MAQSNNPGTPPVAGASGNEGNTNQNPGQNAGGEGSNPPGNRRLIAGKYETIEDAVEQGIFGMEKAFHQTREDLARVTRVLEHAVGARGNQQPQNYVPVGSGAPPNWDAYGRGAPSNDPDYIDPAQFIVNPSQYLKARDNRMLQNVAGVVENVVQNAMVVQEFKRTNPDLVPHERIVRAFMNETDQTKSYPERLDDAAKRTREYLTTVRAAGGGNANPAPSGSSYVENPRGGPGGYNPPIIPGQNMPNAVDEEEKELLDYISERNKDISARFGIKT